LSKYKKIDISKIRTRKISDRKAKAEISKAGIPVGPPATLSQFMNALPDYLKASDLLEVAGGIAKAKQHKRPIIWMMGAHPIKVGLSKILVDLAEQGFMTHLALSGAGAIHDLEMAFFGKTSEEVSEGLSDGSFGMVDESPALLFQAASLAKKNMMGLGEGIGKFICDNNPKYPDHSLLASCYTRDIPVTVHVAIGTDTICQHPGFNGAIFGKLSYDDFLIFSRSIADLTEGVVLNIGSAVILPEVFLKCLTVARNVSGRVDNFTAVNFDMIQHYRPNTNVVTRPVAQSGRGYSFTGHHEIMIPLLAAAIKVKSMETTGKE
jgi:hypothetical protein